MRVGIIGLGGAGSVHLKALDQEATAQVVAVSDPSPAARAHATENSIAAFETPEQMLESSSLDVVTIASPPHVHPELTAACLSAGAHVLCEKPLAKTTQEALRMMRAAGSAKRHLVLATKFRHVDDLIDARKLIADGMIGTPLSFSISFCSNVPTMASRWNANKGVSGGGVVIDNGCHAFDIVSFLFGSISRVRAAEMRKVQDMDVEDSALIQVQAANNVVGTIELSWSYFTGRDSYLTVQGSEGIIAIGWQHARFKKGNDDWQELPGNRYNKFESHRNMYRALGNLVTDGGTPWISSVDALRTVAAVEAAYRSIDTDSWERVDVKDFAEKAAGARTERKRA